VSGAAVAYVRVSTEEQAAFGGSVAMQRDRLADYCRAYKLQLVETIADQGVSGSIPLDQRKGGKRMLALIAAGAARHVVALKLDRLFRDAANALTQTRVWDKASIDLHLVDMGGTSLNTSSAMGRLMLTMLAGFAEMERNLIAERTRAVLAHKRVRREAYAPTPLGFRREGSRLVEDDGEQALIVRIRAMKAAGQSYHAIAAALNAEGVVGKRGGKFHGSTIRYLLANPLHAATA
jgi:site-specific DNA recombinase